MNWMVRRREGLKVLVVLGTRPEAIKLAPVIHELRRLEATSTAGAELYCADGQQCRRERVEVNVCVTAQHREMLDQALRLFGIVPDFDLDVMGPNQSPAQVAATVLTRLEPILRDERPDWVLVQGDTTTVAAASLGAYYAGIRVGHVEAGLRTHDKWQPFPEEINRRIAGVIADLHFAPTARARQNLLLEGVPDHQIVVTGNPVIDALHWVVDRASPNGGPDGAGDWTTPPNARPVRTILVTAHRRENFGEPLEEICQALCDIANRYGEGVHIVFPVHLNPHVRQTVHDRLGNLPNVELTPPLDYLPLVRILQRTYLVLTDSGGLQEEAPGLGKPVLVLRDVTERPEAVEAGTVKLVGRNRQRIVAETCRLLDDQQAYEQMARAVNPYGDGHAAERIVAALMRASDDERAGNHPAAAAVGSLE